MGPFLRVMAGFGLRFALSWHQLMVSLPQEHERLGWGGSWWLNAKYCSLSPIGLNHLAEGTSADLACSASTPSSGRVPDFILESDLLMSLCGLR